MGPAHRLLSFLTIATAFHHNWTTHGQVCRRRARRHLHSKPTRSPGYRALTSKAAQEPRQVKGQGGIGGRRNRTLGTPGSTTIPDEEEEELISSQDDYDWEEFAS